MWVNCAYGKYRYNIAIPLIRRGKKGFHGPSWEAPPSSAANAVNPAANAAATAPAAAATGSSTVVVEAAAKTGGSRGRGFFFETKLMRTFCLPLRFGVHPGRLHGTWKSSEPNHHDFRFELLIFRGVGFFPFLPHKKKRIHNEFKRTLYGSWTGHPLAGGYGESRGGFVSRWIWEGIWGHRCL